MGYLRTVTCGKMPIEDDSLRGKSDPRKTGSRFTVEGRFSFVEMLLRVTSPSPRFSVRAKLSAPSAAGTRPAAMLCREGEQLKRQCGGLERDGRDSLIQRQRAASSIGV